MELSPPKAVGPLASMPRRRHRIFRRIRERDTLGWIFILSRLWICTTNLPTPLANLGVSCWVGNRFSAKQNVFDTVTGLGGDLISRLRSDANLRYLYTGPPKDRPGRPKQYDGNIDWNDQ